ncbi:hypothetical protein CHUAL_002657 [Chamberlinius hualienensis]
MNNILATNYAAITLWWLDGTNASKNGKWIWQYSQSPIDFTDWYLGKPTLGLPNYCLVFWEVDGWRWSDLACPTAINYICQAQP